MYGEIKAFLTSVVLRLTRLGKHHGRKSPKKGNFLCNHNVSSIAGKSYFGKSYRPKNVLWGVDMAGRFVLE